MSASPAGRRKNAAGSTSAPLNNDLVAHMQQEFQSTPAYGVMQNIVTQVSIESLTKRRDTIIESSNHTFSVQLDNWDVTWQKSSGRCWLFAGTNLLRVGAMKKLKLRNFEFSQNYMMFWDKLEKANYVLEAVIETAGRDIDDRTVATLMIGLVSDGGQWDMFVNLVLKHGLVPKSVMPETESSSNSGSMNKILITKLRQGAKTLRDLAAGGATLQALRAAKQEILTTIYRVLCIHLGTPPTRFDWQWTDDNRKLHRETGMTPQRFAAKYVTIPLEDYVCLIHDPRRANPEGRTYTVEYLGNVVGGNPTLYLNISMDLMKAISVKVLKRGEPVWFGADVAHQSDREEGIFDARLRDYDNLYNTDLGMDAEARLLYRHSTANHAMLFTGVDVVAGKPRRWRVENSWGDKTGKQGFFLMHDSWFSDYVFEIAANKKHLPANLRKALSRKPTVLPIWDPMGALLE